MSNLYEYPNPLLIKIALYIFDLDILPISSIIKLNLIAYTIIAIFFPILTPKCVVLIP